MTDIQKYEKRTDVKVELVIKKGNKFYIFVYSSNLLLSYIAERALQPILEGLLDQVRKLDGFDNFILPSPKIPENNDIKPSGHNYTRPNEAVFINIIPPGVDILQKKFQKCPGR